jgi:hypothetical protein
MVETVESVFGTETKEPTTNVPEFALTALKTIADEYELEDTTDLKNQVVKLLNNSAIAGIKEEQARWVAVVRATRATLNGMYATSEQTPMVYQPYSVGFVPIPVYQKEDTMKQGTPKSFSVKSFGVVRSLNEETPLTGPCYVWVTGFVSKDAANQFIGALKTKALYKIGGNISKKSPRGKLENGTVGTVYANAGSTFEPYTPQNDDDGWVANNVIAYFPESHISEVLTKPDFTRIYRVVGDITHSATRLGDGNRARGNITLVDDTVTKDIAKASRGGLFLFLPDDAVQIAALPVGSRVEALVEGYERKVKDKASGNYTGESTAAWSVHAVRTLLDLSDGSSVPNPGSTAIKVNKEAVQRRKLTL